MRALRERRAASEWHDDDSLVFPSMAGTVMDGGNLHRRTLKLAAQEAGVGWAAFHAIRHYCASRLIADGRNIVQVSRWLGHHSRSFTLSTYAHLMNDGVGDALTLPSKVATKYIRPHRAAAPARPSPRSADTDGVPLRGL